MTNHGILYGTDGCHLCDLAMDACKTAGILECVTVIDIADDPNLFEKFGVHIPVLNINNTVLYWPFDGEQIKKSLV